MQPFELVWELLIHSLYTARNATELIQVVDFTRLLQICYQFSHYIFIFHIYLVFSAERRTACLDEVQKLKSAEEDDTVSLKSEDINEDLPCKATLQISGGS